MNNSSALSPAGQALVSLILYIIYRFFVSMGASPYYLWLFGGAAILCALSALKSLADAFLFWRMTRKLFQPTGLYGEINLPTVRDIEKLENSALSFSNDDGDGIPLGSNDDKIIYWRGKGHMSVRAPTEGGKTASSAAPILFALGKHRNIIITAKGAELAVLCGRHRESLGQNVIYIDPYRLMKKYGRASHDYNPVGHLVAYADKGDSKLFDKAMGFALSALPDPEGGNGENRIFKSQGRDILSNPIAYLAYREATTGELSCNLPYLRRSIAGSHEDLVNLLNEMKLCDAFDGDFKRAADRILAKMERAPKSAESFLTEAQDALQIYATGALAKNTEYSDFNAQDLKNPDTPTCVFIILPADLMQSHGGFTGHCLNSMIDVCMGAETFEPRVTVIADEFASLGVVASIPNLIFQGRSYGVQLISYVQDVASYNIYGKNASIFSTNSEIILAWGIRSTSDGEDYSKKTNQLSVITGSGNMPVEAAANASGWDKTSLGLSEKGIAHYRADQFLHMPEYTAALFYKNHPCQMIGLVSYQMVDPWKYQAEPVLGAPSGSQLPIKFKA